MSKLFLRMFAIDTLIEMVIDLLAATIRNRDGAKALQLRGIVNHLYRASKEFLQRTGGIPEDF